MTTEVATHDFSTPGRVITITNPYTEITLRQAHEEKMNGAYEKALSLYDQVLEMDPREPRAHHAKGNIHDLMGRFADAISCYDSALACDPFNAETLFNKSVTLEKMGCSEDAEACLLQSVQLSV